ncbi:DUF3472 domain-containing protein [Sulfuriroseicoccus oceanibius]|uniref:DUF3472 domain-containing protein n=1 Tax=Sulfuriroseicoccus oceanibius TaxID=2707525 RepID=A0A6B3LCL3_9BACT|nr:DUF3472 domain-containing protein [Sulfuriroseicoccus oceanibius]QQL45926.1 DUF3472 domain-containing protein [Sulfuriroseicoccus oceanibius]
MIKLASLALGALALAASVVTSSAISPEELVKRQCRSIHLGYQAPPGEWAMVDVTATKSAPGTYFCAMGFNKGYFGMQELHNGKKVIIFSVWDSKSDPRAHIRADDTPEEDRVGVIEIGEGVRPDRFGGEGTGSKSFFAYDWKIDEPVRFAVHAKPEGKFTTFSGYFFDSKRKVWQLMAKFRTEHGEPLGGYYSFIEDFRRNYESAKISRTANFTNGWVKSTDGKWVPMVEARFTGDSTPSTNIDAGPIEDGFFLATGGDTEPKTTKLWDVMKRNAPKAEAPELNGLPGAE